MEVASALLEASRKMSGSSESTNSSSSSSSFVATASWSSSISEQEERTLGLPVKDSWLGGWASRTRNKSEGESMSSSVGSWMVGLGAMRERANTGPAAQTWGQGRLGGWGFDASLLRRSSKEVEEAIAGGLPKSEIFMPPM